MTGKLKICNFGKNMLQIFYVTTLFAAIYLILGFAGGFYETMVCERPGRNYCREKILADPSVYYIPGRDCDILDWNDQRVSDITTAGNPLARAGAYMWLDPDCASGDAARISQTVRRESEVRSCVQKRNAAQQTRRYVRNKVSDSMVHGVLLMILNT